MFHFHILNEPRGNKTEFVLNNQYPIHMPRTIKLTLSVLQQKFKIVMLKNQIRTLSAKQYLDLAGRIELKNAEALLKSLEMEQDNISGRTYWSFQ